MFQPLLGHQMEVRRRCGAYQMIHRSKFASDAKISVYWSIFSMPLVIVIAVATLR